MRAAVLLVIGVAAGAQQPSPAFDVATIKQNRSATNGGNGRMRPGGAISMTNATVRQLIELAYELQDYQLSGGPGWIATTCYDLEAKPASAVDAKTARLMLQNLLAERLSLKVHHEDATINGFHLAVDKGGSKLKASDAPGIGFRIMFSDTYRIQGSGDMGKLVSALRGMLRAPVEDRTGMAGSYDIDLKWTADVAAGSASEPSVSIFAAIRELGLSLETAKVAIDRIVIDHLERPAEN